MSTIRLLAEARQAMLLARVADAGQSSGRTRSLSARDVLRVATRGGADVLGRDDIGMIAPGRAADIIAVVTCSASIVNVRGS
jgi:8-oxoguanine deaminase